MVERYYNNENQLAVLFSPGYGFGWSTEFEAPEIAWDKRITEFWVNENPPAYALRNMLVKLGYSDAEELPDGVFESLEVAWIPKGSPFYIESDEGAERVITSEIMIA